MNEVRYLSCLISIYCKARNLDRQCYIDGLLSGGPLDSNLINILVRYHEEWMRNG